MTLQEADKSRFLKLLYDTYANDSSVDYSQLLNFVNKDDQILKNMMKLHGLDWQKPTEELWNAICEAYGERTEKQKEHKAVKDIFSQNDVLSIIKASGLRLAGEDEEAANCDFVHLSDLGDEKFTFVAPMTYRAAVFCDSVECGGEGAKWCIGYKKNDDYWVDYIQNGNLFILAFNNEAFKKGKARDKDTLKYMIQLCPDGSQTQAWLQCDDPDGTIHVSRFKKLFGCDAIEMVQAFADRILCCDDNAYSENSEGDFYDDETGSPTYPWDDDDLVDKNLYIEDFYSGEYDLSNGKASSSNAQKVYDAWYGEAYLKCEGAAVDPSKMHIDSPMFKNGVFDTSEFCDFLAKCRVKNAFAVNIENGKFKKVIWCPEATNNQTSFNFYGCEIDELVWEDYSDEGVECSFGNGSQIHNVVVCGTEDEYENSMKSLNIIDGSEIHHWQFDDDIILEETTLKKQNELFDKVLSGKEKLDERGNSSIVAMTGITLAVAACAFGVKSCKDSVADGELKDLGSYENYKEFNADNASTISGLAGLGDTQAKAMYATIVSYAREKDINIEEAANALQNQSVVNRLFRELRGTFSNDFRGRIVDVQPGMKKGERVIQVTFEYEETRRTGSGESSRTYHRVRDKTVNIPVSEGNLYGIDDDGKSMNINGAVFKYSESARRRRVKEARIKIPKLWPVGFGSIKSIAEELGLEAERDSFESSVVNLINSSDEIVAYAQTTQKGYIMHSYLGSGLSYDYEGNSSEEFKNDLEDLLSNIKA